MEGELLLPLYLYRFIRLDFVTINLVVILDYTIIILGGKVGCEVRAAYYCQLISVNRLNDVGIGFTTFKNCNIGAIHMLEGVLRFTINVDCSTPFLAFQG